MHVASPSKKKKEIVLPPFGLMNYCNIWPTLMIIKLFVKFLNFFGKFLTMMLKALKILITKH